MSFIKKILTEKPIIQTKRTIIQPFEINAKTIFELYDIYRDYDNTKNYCRLFDDFDEYAGYISEKIQLHQNTINGIVSFVIMEKETTQIIGVRNFIQDNKYTKNGVVEEIYNSNFITEIVINKKFWRQGFAEETSLSLFSYLKEKGIKNILSFINESNTKAKKMDQKLGFKKLDLNEIIEVYNFHQDCTLHSTYTENAFIKVL